MYDDVVTAASSTQLTDSTPDGGVVATGDDHLGSDSADVGDLDAEMHHSMEPSVVADVVAQQSDSAAPCSSLPSLPEASSAPQHVLSSLERWLFTNGHFVEPYETYRVARLMECSEWTAISVIEQECDVILPQYRHLGHVLGTSPHLFELNRPHQPDAKNADSGDRAVRYRVPPAHLTHRNYSKEAVATMERKVHAIRQMKFPQRDKMRRLLREIVEGRGKHPFLDPSVFAFALFDCLPVQGEAVTFTSVVHSRFTKTQRDCRPILLQPFFETFKGLFVVAQERNSNELLVSRRTSSPAPDSSHTAGADTAHDEEVVMSLFERFPVRHDPNVPIPHYSVRALLSLRVQRAIRLRGWAAIGETQGDKIEVIVLSQPEDSPVTLKLTRSGGHVAGENAGVEAVRFRGRYLESLLETHRRLGGGAEAKEGA
jgi:hypothetical protein